MVSKSNVSSDELKRQAEQKYMQLQMLAEHMKTLQRELQNLSSQVVDLESTNEALSEFGSVAGGSEILVPIAGGIFCKAVMGDTKDLIVNIGGRAAVKKSVSDVRVMLSEQTVELRNAEVEVARQLERVASEAGSIEAELKGFVGDHV